MRIATLSPHPANSQKCGEGPTTVPPNLKKNGIHSCAEYVHSRSLCEGTQSFPRKPNNPDSPQESLPGRFSTSPNATYLY